MALQEYRFHVMDIKGKTKKGVMAGNSIDQVAALLQKQGYYIIAPIRPALQQYLSLKPKKLLDSLSLATFASKLSMLLAGGVPLLAALEAILQNCRHNDTAKAIKVIIEGLEKGESLHKSVEHSFFPSFFQQVIKIGEISGHLPQSLQLLNQYYHHRHHMGKKLSRAAFYPTIVLVSALLVLGLFITYVLPQANSLLLTRGAELPALTKMLLKVTEYSFWGNTIIYLGAFVLGLLFMKHTPRGRRYLSLAGWRAPLLSQAYAAFYYHNLSRALGFMLHSGIAILYALKILQNVLDDQVLKEKLSSCIYQLDRGSSLYDAFSEANIFYSGEIELIGAAEKVGDLGEVFLHLADYYNKQLEHHTEKLTTVFEPLLIIILTLLVALIVGGILLPIYEMGSFSQL